MKIIINQRKKLKNLRRKMNKYNIDSFNITPARISFIQHRSECNVYNFDNKLPLFTAPMNSVVNDENFEVFNENKINTIIPRGVDFTIRVKMCNNTFVAMSLQEFSDFIDILQKKELADNDIFYICIDVANGHMAKLIDMCSAAKQMFNHHVVIMTGNIANPETYVQYAIAGIDFVRCGIGGSGVCLTSKKTGVHYPMGSLIKEIADKKWTIERCIADSKQLNINCEYKSVPFIVADGGIDSIDRIIKALSLGADYVMCGRIFAQSEEACGESYWQYPKDPTTLSEHDKQRLVYHEPVCEYGFHLREYYGMSTHRAQKETGRKTLAAEEGIETYVDIKYTLSDWCYEFISALQSAMSYTNSLNLEEFKNCTHTIITR